MRLQRLQSDIKPKFGVRQSAYKLDTVKLERCLRVLPLEQLFLIGDPAFEATDFPVKGMRQVIGIMKQPLTIAAAAEYHQIFAYVLGRKSYISKTPPLCFTHPDRKGDIPLTLTIATLPNCKLKFPNGQEITFPQ